MISIKEFIEWAKVSCWNIKENEKCDVNLSNKVRERYKAIPYEYF